MIFMFLLFFACLKASLPSAAYSPNKLGEVLCPYLPQLVGEVPKGRWGPLRRILSFISSYLQEDAMDKIRPLQFARNLRTHQTSAEAKLRWSLRRRGLGGFRFNRQLRMGPYVADFVCREKGLVVEVDGATHGERRELNHDAKRSAFLVAQGYQVYRVGNVDVYENLSGVLDGILMALETAPNAFQRKAPSPLRGTPPTSWGRNNRESLPNLLGKCPKGDGGL
jgi:very-short-patch-repair endonuclease